MRICILLLLILGAAACKKKTTKIVIVPPVLPESYMPATTGSTWKYAISGIFSSTNVMTATGRDTTFPISAITYKVMDINGSSKDYQSKVGNDYYITVPNSNFHNPYKVIKGDAVVNERWLGAVVGTDSYFVQLLEKDILYQQDTFKFDKTIHVKQTRKNSAGNIDMDLDTWVVYNVGIVKTGGNISGFPYQSKLIEANIK